MDYEEIRKVKSDISRKRDARTGDLSEPYQKTSGDGNCG